MRGVHLTEDRQLKLMSVDIPQVMAKYVRVKVKRSGICASDLGYWKHGSSRLKNLPIILGHEGCGIVDEVGAGVNTLKKGDRVIVMTTYTICGRCKYCVVGSTNLCAEREGIGSKRNGLFAEYVLTPESSCILMPDHLSYEEGAGTELLACSVRAIITHGQVNATSNVLVVGPGPMGLMVSLVAKANGATVILAGLEKDRHRLNLAKSLGIDYVVNIEKESIEESVYKLSKYGMDICLETAGHPKSFDMCLEQVRKQGKVIQLGLPYGKAEVDWQLIVHKEIKVFGALSQTPIEWYQAIELMASKKINIKPLFTHCFSLSDFMQGFETAFEQKGIKILFNPEL